MSLRCMFGRSVAAFLLLFLPFVAMAQTDAVQVLRLASENQAVGPLTGFDGSSFEEIAERLAQLTSSGVAIELPLALGADFPLIEIAGVRVFVDTERKSVAIRGTKTIRGRAYDVMFSTFWGSHHDPRSKALSIKGQQFDGFFPAGGLLDDLASSTAWFVISCGDYKLKSEELPEEVADYYGDEEIDVKLGLNLFSKVIVKDSHWLADVAMALDIDQAFIDLHGFIGPSVEAAFSSEDGPKVKMGPETTLSAAIPLWIPRRFRGVFSEMKGQLELGLGLEHERTVSKTQTNAKASAQISLVATVELPFLATRNRLNDKIEFTGALAVEKSAGEKAELKLSLGADDIFQLPAFKDVIDLHAPTMTVTFKRDEKRTHEVSFSAKADVGRYKNFGSIKIARVSSISEVTDSTSLDAEKPPFGGVPTPFKQAELLAKQRERDKAAKEKPKTDWNKKLVAELSVDPTALGAIRPRELLLDLFNFAGNLDLLPDGPELETLNLRFLPEAAGSMVMSGSTMLNGSPTYFIGSRVQSTDGKNGVLFGVAPQHWSFRESFPEANIPLLSELEISNVGLLIATKEFTASSDDLFGEEYGFYRALYQQDDFVVKIQPGVNLIATLPLDGMNPESPLTPLMEKLGVQRGPALLQGAIGTKVKDLYLRASLPPLSPPGSPSWFDHGQLDIELTGQPSIALVGSLALRLEEEIVVFFVKTKAGREGLIVAGGMDAPGGWREPFGIDWMTMNRTTLLLGLTPAGSLQLGFEGDLVIGEKDVRVAVLTALNAATGVPTNFMFDGESEAGVAVADLVTLQAAIASARSGAKVKPIPVSKLPLLGVEDLKLKFAPKDSPELNIDRGLAIGGMLTMQSSPDQPADLIAAAEFDVSEEGVVSRAALGDFELGHVSLSDASIDLTLTPQEQYFRMSGMGDLVIMQAAVDVDIARSEMRFDAEGKAFGLFMAQIEAVGRANLKDPQFTAVGTLRNDFHSSLAKELVNEMTDAAAKEVARANRESEAAISAHNDATAASARARKVWADTPALPRAKKIAARDRWQSAVGIVATKLEARTRAATQYAKWSALHDLLVAAQKASSVASPVKIKSAKFDGDLSRMKDGQVAHLLVVAEVDGREVHLSNAGFNFYDMGPGLKDLAGQLVQRMFQSQR